MPVPDMLRGESVNPAEAGSGASLRTDGEEGASLSACAALLHGSLPDPERLRMSSPVALAFVGDSIFDLYLRTRLVSRSGWPPRELHRRASRYANAGAQAAMVKNIEEMLTGEERAVFRRGRNAKTYSMPKNAKPEDYRFATGFEAVLGYLFLSGRDARLLELMDAAVQSIKENSLIL